VLLSQSDGTFASQVEYTTGNLLSSVVVGDFDGNGKADLGVAVDSTPSLAAVLSGVGDGTFIVPRSNRADYPTGSWPTSVAIGDLNGDSRLDLAVADADSDSVGVLVAEPMAPSRKSGLRNRAPPNLGGDRGSERRQPARPGRWQ